MKNLMNRVKAGFSKTVVQTDAVCVLALAGAAADQKSRILIGCGTVAGVVAVAASSPVVIKTAVALSGGMFIMGMLSGFKKALNEE